ARARNDRTSSICISSKGIRIPKCCSRLTSNWIKLSESRIPPASKSSSGEATSRRSFSVISVRISSSSISEPLLLDMCVSLPGARLRLLRARLRGPAFSGCLSGCLAETLFHEYAVDLTVCVVRHRIQNHPSRRDHIVGQQAADVLLHGRGGCIAARGRHIGAADDNAL